MFTGLIEDKGRVISFSAGDIIISTSIHGEVDIGDSVAVDGSCLTVTSRDGDKLVFHCSSETISRTIASGYHAGTDVNIERPMKLSQRLHGHMVTGHIDETARILQLRKAGGDATVWISFSSGRSRLIVEKGSVAVNGISLTIASIKGNRFSVVLIRETLERTNACNWKPGTLVNLEYDIIGKYIQKQFIAAEGSERLREYLER